MVKIICGKRGKGKTKILLDQANEAVKTLEGSIVYLDKSSKHMYELNNQIRLINVMDYRIDSYEKFLGFISGLIASNHDIEQLYLDSFLKLSCLEGKDITDAVLFLNQLGQIHGLTFILSISADESELSDEVKKYISVSL